MPQPIDELPKSLRERAKAARLAGAPALLAHPDWATPAPFCLWFHGRTAHKELDPGRYSRWVRSGIAAVAIDLPGHGERASPGAADPGNTLDVIEAAVAEIDPILTDLHANFPGVFAAERCAIGGMSLGGMVALRRCCDEHPFSCAAVESTTGWLQQLYHPDPSVDARARPWPASHTQERIAPVDPIRHLDGFRPIPLLASHSEADEIVPFGGMAAFLAELAAHYTEAGASAELITLKSWPTTGAPSEHSGFGRHAAESKDLQTAFLAEHLAASEL